LRTTFTHLLTEDLVSFGECLPHELLLNTTLPQGSATVRPKARKAARAANWRQLAAAHTDGSSFCCYERTDNFKEF
jgi:hypothetical protein